MNACIWIIKLILIEVSSNTRDDALNGGLVVVFETDGAVSHRLWNQRLETLFTNTFGFGIAREIHISTLAFIADVLSYMLRILKERFE